MSARLSKALRALIEARNLDKHMIETLSEIGNKDDSPSHDRTLAIVAAVYIEDSLRNAIAKHLNPYRVNEYQSLIFTDDQAPLSGLASRTRMAFALGVIVEAMRKDLTLIRGIRNAFAHTPSAVTFNTPVVRDAVEALSVLESLSLQEVVADVGIDKTSRARFIVAVATLCRLIDRHDGYWGPSSFWRKAIEMHDSSLDTQPQPRPQDQKNPDDNLQSHAHPPRSSRE